MNMTPQEIFDKVATHLLTQNEKCVNEYQECRYRAGFGNSCAVGCLFPKDFDVLPLEGTGVQEFIVREALVPFIGPIDTVKRALLQQLQSVHDSYPPSKWLYRLELMAMGYDLSDEVLNPWRNK